ncbi:hypothetical protein F5Y16DRAFT_225097 [Xylariaceae sp. FL0255]|nr:hypothetical protein F5Y16DRAFT_225097 [Xylariaceae sp. FL0255]
MEVGSHRAQLESFGMLLGRTHLSQTLEASSRALHPQPVISSPSSPQARETSTRIIPRSGGVTARSVCQANHRRSDDHDTYRASRSLAPALPSALSPGRLDAPKEIKQELQTCIMQQKVPNKEEFGAQPRRNEPRSNHLTTSQLGTLTLPYRPPKRRRAPHDVDGPGTDILACKKRRLLLNLVTSRLSRPFSLPATHILIRESSDNMPVLHRIQQLASLARARVGHQSSLVRKAAILNRIRIGVRQAAVLRGHTIMANLAARGSALNHGLQLVTTPSSSSMFPSASTQNGAVLNNSSASPVTASAVTAMTMPPGWRPHTTSFHRPIPPGNNSLASTRLGISQDSDRENPEGDNLHKELAPATTLRSPGPFSTSAAAATTAAVISCRLPLLHAYPYPTYSSEPASDDEDNTAFPASSFHDRYADLSDDDMDDVYADFGVLFGSASSCSSPEAESNPAEEQFYEEYLDELDGIPWIV